MDCIELVCIVLFIIFTNCASSRLNFQIQYCERTIHTNSDRQISLMFFCQSSDVYDQCVIGKEITAHLQKDCTFSKTRYIYTGKIFLKKESCTHNRFLWQIGYYGVPQSEYDCRLQVLTLSLIHI